MRTIIREVLSFMDILAPVELIPMRSQTILYISTQELQAYSSSFLASILITPIGLRGATVDMACL